MIQPATREGRFTLVSVNGHPVPILGPHCPRCHVGQMLALRDKWGRYLDCIACGYHLYGDGYREARSQEAPLTFGARH